MPFFHDPHFWIALVALLIGLAVAFAIRLIAAYYARRKGSKFADAFVRNASRPLLFLLPLFFGRAVQPLLDITPTVAPIVRHAATLVMIFLFAWLLVSLTSMFRQLLTERLLSGVRDDIGARRVLTRVSILGRALAIVIVVLSGAAMLMTFPGARAIGASIFASAGIAGVVLGIAARPAVETLIAGLQIALTEPISIEDVVIVEGQWGRIEEITATYVVVRIWDLRRLIVPITYFLHQPFQNWTRAGDDLLAQVTVEVDYSTPVEEVRTRAGEIVAESKFWDGKFWNLQMTEATERTIRLRVLASAASSEAAWDMRCEIRERLVEYLQKAHPWALPRIRTSSVETAAAVA